MKTLATRDCLVDEGTVWKPKCVVWDGLVSVAGCWDWDWASRREQERQRYWGRGLRKTRREDRRAEVRWRVGVDMVLSVFFSRRNVLAS